jgi:CHAT domain-containing protein
MKGDRIPFKGDRTGEAITIDYLGRIYASLGETQKALALYNQSLPLSRAVSNRSGEAKTLANIGTLLNPQQPEVSIVFYKQSVNLYETLRQAIRQLPREIQETYTKSVAKTYRALADSLIAQGRIGEAQQVLERLKIQELNDFTKGTRAPATIADVGFNPIETQIKGKYTSLIAFGGKFYECEQQRCPQYSELKTQYENLSKEFQVFVEQIKQQLHDGRLTQVNTSTQDFQNSADRIVTAHPNSILIYPLVLADKTRILWAFKGGVLSKTAICPLGETALYNKVAQFQKLISQRHDETELKAVGKELYDCLIKPLEGELTANQIQHLIFVPDRATNYIPMGALFDGKQYLIQRFAVSNILSAGLTDTDDRLQSLQQTPVLALGLTQAKGNFGALPNVASELSAIVKRVGGTGIYPGDTYLDQAFTKSVLEDNLRGHRIIHIATHGEFKPTNPRDSYFLLGTGTPYPIPDVQNLRDLKDVHLVVLSACQTGLGGADGLGLEVSGMSSFFMGDRTRAKAVLASLWQVNDASTGLLMQQFYQNLARGTMSKVEALRQAQLAMIQDKRMGAEGNRGSFIITTTNPDGQTQTIDRNFSHPYYWAPFILIGNSL